ncbi:phosphotransferase [Vibrio sp. CAIM 722]|uniref:Hydroxylysine kinase n=1 Tax=Vibrio eleionomae TaxID=2653505 RepID=A0A7X4LPV9_9VIBR|nr:phosphotransferase [Vibrio eleionomae]MZI95958.1 phosphotransferase [Vibrio eleionomae]
MTKSDTRPIDIADFGAELKTKAVIIQPAEAQAIALEHYGLQGKVKWLWGEKDSNYQLTLTDGTEYLLKILNSGEAREVTQLHSKALLQVEQYDSGIPLQRIVKTCDGELDCRVNDNTGTERGVRLVTFVPGKAQTQFNRSSEQRKNVGRILARLQTALSPITLDSDLPPIIWDMSHASMMRGFIEFIDDIELRHRLTQALDCFDNEIIPVMDQLPTQFIHNDFNLENILVDQQCPNEVCGIIDFGDMAYAPVLFDTAVAISYQLGTSENVLDEACDVLKGYASVKSMSPLEIELLYPAIIMRIVMRLTISVWRATIFPDQKTHLLRFWPTLKTQLTLLDAIGREEMTRRFFTIFEEAENE